MVSGVNKTLLILGSGKTARDIGLWFRGKGYCVTWHAGEAHFEDLERFVQRVGRRDPGPKTTVGRLGEVLENTPDAIIESRAEDLVAKREAFQAVRPYIDENTLLFSNSSSILPETIGPDIAGLHFFYPVPLTEIVELIVPDEWSEERIRTVEGFARAAGLRCVRQSPRNAFYINRLLLPLQAEAARLFIQGCAVDTVDKASVSDLLPVGIWSAADEIGLDVILAGVRNYVDRMPSRQADEYAPLLSVSAAWTTAGILGKKNRRRILKTEDMVLRTLVSDAATLSPPPEDLSNRFRTLLLHTARAFVEDGTCDLSTLSNAAAAAFGGEPIEHALQESVGRVEIDISEGRLPAEAVAPLDGLLDRSGIKGAVVSIQCSGTASPEIAAAVSARLFVTDLPTTAVYSEDAPPAVLSTANACLFQIAARTETIHTAAHDAALSLETLIDKRPVHVIRSIVRSIRNAEALPLEKALHEETKLFCALSRINRATEESQ